MHKTGVLLALAVMIPIAGSSQTQAPSLPLGQGRPDTPGITRTQLRDDGKATVTRVHFKPGAAEPSHTHPNDVLLVPVVAGTVDLTIGDTKLTSVKSGDVQFVPREVTHSVANHSTQDFELIAIALK